MKLELHLSDDVIDALKSAIERSMARAQDDMRSAAERLARIENGQRNGHCEATDQADAAEAKYELRLLECAMNAIDDQLDAHRNKYGVNPK